MIDWEDLLVLACVLGPILLLDGAIVVFGLRAERREQQEATERRHGAAETAVPTAGPPSMGPAGTEVETSLVTRADGSLGPKPAGAEATPPSKPSALAGPANERRHGAGHPVPTAGSVTGAGPAVGTEAEQMRGIAAARSLGPHHSSSAGADSTVPDQSSALAGIQRWWP